MAVLEDEEEERREQEDLKRQNAKRRKLKWCHTNTSVISPNPVRPSQTVRSRGHVVATVNLNASFFSPIHFSLRMGIREDAEDIRMEEEERKQKLAMKAKRKKV